jgi:DNA-binding CsgD family transcriptional regulator
MNTRTALTPREIDVLRLIARGCTYKQAARRLGISQHTITTYIKSSYYKLAVHSAGAAVMRAVELGLLVPVADIAEPVQLAGDGRIRMRV